MEQNRNALLNRNPSGFLSIRIFLKHWNFPWTMHVPDRLYIKAGVMVLNWMNTPQRGFAV
ncbi:hypothetical protein D3C87_1751360 [compost metagenome]